MAAAAAVVGSKDRSEDGSQGRSEAEFIEARLGERRPLPDAAAKVMASCLFLGFSVVGQAVVWSGTNDGPGLERCSGRFEYYWPLVIHSFDHSSNEGDNLDIVQ